MSRSFFLGTVLVLVSTNSVSSFHSSSMAPAPCSRNVALCAHSNTRRNFIHSTASISAGLLFSAPANAEKAFAPGGTLVDYEVGVQVGNKEASKSRKSDNTNVIFNQDYYFKFGTAPQWIEEGNTEFPKTMPFTPSQQRYETLKKYGERVQRGVDLIASLGEKIKNGDYNSILDGSAPEYYIRPMGEFTKFLII